VGVVNAAKCCESHLKKKYSTEESAFQPHFCYISSQNNGNPSGEFVLAEKSTANPQNPIPSFNPVENSDQLVEKLAPTCGNPVECAGEN
jgi:hypothetical protein